MTMKKSQTKNLLGGCTVILCTLSLLANPKLREHGFLYHVPIDTIVVDEASQVEISMYLPALATYNSIRKMCFFGDDKQCEYHLVLGSAIITPRHY
jgi:regulator of nonsense transcripts 1